MIDDDTAAATAASSVGSNLFAASALLVIALLVLLTIRHYLPLRNTPQWLLVPVFLALFLPSSIILLVPIDCVATNASKAIWLPERVTLVAWRIAYWLTFVLTWFILPLLGEYCDSGFRDTRERVADAVRSNLRYQMIVLSAGALGLVYFIFENGFHFASIKGLLMALAYTWGLILAIGLMGHGLVAIPRRLFRNASVTSRLRWLHSQAPKIKDKLDEASEKLEHLEQTVSQLGRLKSGASTEQEEWIDELANIPDSRPTQISARQTPSAALPAVVTDRYLAELTRKLKRARHRKARFVDEWDSLVQRAQETQTILDSAASRQLDFGRTAGWSGIKLLTSSMRFHLHMNIIPALRIAFSGALAIASVLVVWSEVVRAFFPNLSVIGLTVVHHPSSTSGGRVNVGGQIIAALWLLYMDAAALYAIQDVKVWGNRALVKRQTYGESACWYSMQIAKLTVPLSYNFVTMLSPTVFENTMFFQFLGKLLDLTPLGYGFSRFFPCFVLIPVFATLFNVYGRMKNVLGFGFLEDESEENVSGFGTGGWREGKALIDRELQSRGVGDGILGLDARGASLDLERNVPRDSTNNMNASSASVPGRARAEVNVQGSFRDQGIREANRQFNSIANQEEEDESPRHFYQDLGERIQNTFSTAETPEFMQKIGSAFKTPRWMQDNETGASPLAKWFGGRAEDGRLRL